MRRPLHCARADCISLKRIPRWKLIFDGICAGSGGACTRSTSNKLDEDIVFICQVSIRFGVWLT